MVKNNDNLKGKRWNQGLTLVSVINIFIITYYYFSKHNLNKFSKKLTILVMIYTYVCAIRGIYPRIEDSGLCAYDNTISKPIIGRTLATVAELSFAMFFVLLTKTFLKDIFKINNNTNLLGLKKINNVLFPLIILAQIFCWIGSITKDTQWNALEESLWAIFALVKVVIYSIMYYNIYKISNNKLTNSIKLLKMLIPFIVIFMSVYFIYMVCIDVPLYIKKSKNYKGKLNSLFQGLKELSLCRVVTFSYKKWKNEIPWLTSYFTLAVWFAIFMLIFYNDYYSKV